MSLTNMTQQAVAKRGRPRKHAVPANRAPLNHADALDLLRLLVDAKRLTDHIRDP